VIVGPAAVDSAQASSPLDSVDVRADLEHLFAVRDADFRRHETREGAGDEATQPMFLGTEPAKL